MDINQNWKKVRDAYEFLKSKDATQAVVKHSQLFTSTESLYLAEQEVIKNEEMKSKERAIAEAKEAEERAIIEAKEAKKRAIIEEREAKKQAIIEAKEAKKRAILEAKEAKEFERQQKLEQLRIEKEAKAEERRRLAEEKRLAREGDGSPDDSTCKSLGAKPGTDNYILCRLKLAEESNRRQQAQQEQIQMQQQLQAEQERRYQEQVQMQQQLQAEQQRRYQEQIQIQRQLQAQEQARQEAADRQRRLDGLETFFRALQGAPQSTPYVAPTRKYFLKNQWISNGNRMCAYDDGSVINIGVGFCPSSR